MNHPALTLGYRIEADGTSVVYACDHEPHSRGYASGKGTMSEQDRHHVEFIKGADLVIHDAQYTRAEYEEKVGWGHSTVECVVDMCRHGHVRQLALTHHDPLRDDEKVDQVCENVNKDMPQKDQVLKVFAAAEGMVVQIPSFPKVAEKLDVSESAMFTSVDSALYDHKVLFGLSDQILTEKLEQAASADNLQTLRAATYEEIIELIRFERPSVLVIGEDFSEREAIQTCQEIRKIDVDYIQDLPVIIVSNKESETDNKTCITDWLIQPFSIEYARSRIRAWVMRNVCRWKRAPLVKDEVRRIEALKDLSILDTEAEERFDQITRIAAKAFDVPIALFSLVDSERQWFKSRYGLNAEETHRDQAFCAHTILDEKIMVVRDTLQDSRFADNPLVVGEPRIRFYAGYPLTLPDGSTPGTLCLIDTRPRDLDETKLDLLSELGKLIERELSNTQNE